VLLELEQERADLPPTHSSREGDWESVFAVEQGESVRRRRRPWVVYQGQVLIGREGQFHAELARAHGLPKHGWDAAGEILDRGVRQFQGERTWVGRVEAALRSEEAGG
jgi:hypothetical protein